MEEAMNNHFLGVSLETEKRKRLDNYNRSVLGEDYYLLAKDFFKEVWESTARYKVFLARRCLNLMYAFYRTEYSKPLENADKTFYTDGSLLANAYEIAESYITWNVVPEILIVDDILIHGRTLTRILDCLINMVYDYLTKKEIPKDKSEVEYDILCSVSIKVMVQNDKPMLIKDVYYQKLESKSDMSDVWTPRRWHELSSRISRLVSESYFYNTSFVISMYETDNHPPVHQKIENALKDVGFIVSKWEKRFNRNVWAKPIKNKSGDIVALYTVRVTQNAVDNTYIIVPYVILSDFRLSSLDSFDKINGFINYFERNLNRTRAEALYFILSYNLLMLIKKKAGIPLDEYDNLDIDKISINFRKGRLSESTKWINSVIYNKECLLQWDEMDRLIINGIKDFKPLIQLKNDKLTDNSSNYDTIIEDILAFEGEKIEEDAYLEYTKVYNKSLGAPKKPIIDLFRRVCEKLPLKTASFSNYGELVGSLIRAMDMGMVALSTDINNRDIVSCFYRAGEQSQFIHPKRYSKYLPVLIAMERDCHFIESNIYNRVESFYSDRIAIKNELEKYVSMLYSSGQRLSDWDINLLNWTELDDELATFPEIGQRKKIFHQMIFNTAEQLREYKRYREKYPESAD